MDTSTKALFAPYHPAIGSFWPCCLVQPFTIAGHKHGKTMLHAELIAINHKTRKCKIQYWHDERKEIAGGLVEVYIGELPAIEGEIDQSYRGSFSSKEFKKMQSYDEFESVTIAASDDESVTGVCLVCGKTCSQRAKTCSPVCRKRLSRAKSSL
jgi:hypothetical protein